MSSDKGLNRHQRASAGTHLAVSLLSGLIAFVALIVLGLSTAALIAWVVAAGVFLVWTWSAVWPLTPEQTKAVATRDDASRPVRDFMILGVGLGSLVVVCLVVFRASEVGAVRTWLGIADIALAWLVLHTVFTLRYAGLYYTNPVGGVDFHTDEQPAFRDFAYLAFTVGMTFQVSDTDIPQATIRHTILRQALISYVFGALIIAVTVNLIASLANH
jgi:uncharacterized membrane protein